MKVRASKIVKNAAQCLKCKTVIESKHRHDFVSCECGAIFIDGGHAYIRCGADSWTNFKSLSKSEEFIREETEWEKRWRQEGHPSTSVTYLDSEGNELSEVPRAGD
jgi:hypothetical protein